MLAELAIEEVELAVEEIELAIEEIELTAEEAELAVEEIELAVEEIELAAEEIELAVEEIELAVEEIELAVEEIELAAEEVELATDDAELAAVEDKTLELESLGTTGEGKLRIELVALDMTEVAELAISDASELDAVLCVEEANKLDAESDVTELSTALDVDAASKLGADEIGVTLDEELICDFPPPPPHATRLNRVMLHTIARALWRSGNRFNININDSEIIIVI